MGKHRTLEERIAETKRKLKVLEERKMKEEQRTKTKRRGRKDELYGKILDISKATFYKYVKKGVPIMSFLDRYFTREELEEFTSTGQIRKLELIKNMSYEELQKLIELKKSVEDVLC